MVYSQRAIRNINQIAVYIQQRGYPETAIKFVNKLYGFGESPPLFPDKYPLCKREKLRRKGYRCAIFAKTYILIYKIYSSKIVIHQVVHGRTLA